MPNPHVIRLRGPWECQPLLRWNARDGERRAVDDALPVIDRVQVPSDWSAYLGSDFTGRVRYSRWFNRPTGLDEHVAVWLCCDGANEQAMVTLNGQQLGVLTGADQRRQFDITSLLARRNELRIEVDCDSASTAPGSLAEVRLEIHRRSLPDDSNATMLHSAPTPPSQTREYPTA